MCLIAPTKVYHFQISNWQCSTSFLTLQCVKKDVGHGTSHYLPSTHIWIPVQRSTVCLWAERTRVLRHLLSGIYWHWCTEGFTPLLLHSPPPLEMLLWWYQGFFFFNCSAAVSSIHTQRPLTTWPTMCTQDKCFYSQTDLPSNVQVLMPWQGTNEAVTLTPWERNQLPPS